jgi:hypothetical protein
MKKEKCMKTWKNALIGMVAIIAFGFAFVACDDGNGNDDPKDQSQTITLTFGTETPTATVKGHLTDTEWDGVADKIKDAINAIYSTSNGDPVKDAYKSLFNRGITLNVEKTSEYANWKTTTDGRTIYLNLSTVNGTSLKDKITEALEKVYVNTAGNG